VIRALSAALLLLALPAHAELPVTAAVVVAEHPHDPEAFTEGLFWLDGHLWESTGEEGTSSIRKVDLANGKPVQQVDLPATIFGEGIAPWKDTILSLTWKDGVGYRWSQQAFKRLGRFTYAGEGWALTTYGKELIQSDGSPVLRFVDPATFRTVRKLTVTAEGKPVEQLNELEVVDGEILANIWLTDRIARIDPETGHVLGWIDVAALHDAMGREDIDAVPNGIAWDPATRRLFVTGKRWSRLYEIKPPKDG